MRAVDLAKDVKSSLSLNPYSTGRYSVRDVGSVISEANLS